MNLVLIKKQLVAAYLIICFVCSCTFPVLSQTKSTRFQHLTLEDGLAQNMVDCMLQDAQGFMWFGTWNGLCRYDGYTFEIFNNENLRSSTLKNNFIYALYEDKFGNIWVGTAEGLYVYLYDKGQFLSVNDMLEKPLPGAITVIAGIDSCDLWIGTRQGITVLHLLDEEGSARITKEIKYGLGEDQLSGTSIQTIIRDRSETIWIGTDEGINLMKAENTPIIKINNEPGNPNSISSGLIQEIYETGSGEVWIGTDFGLNKYQPKTGGFVHYYNDPSDPSSLLHNSVMDIIQDDSGNILVATLGGLSVLDSKGQFINYKNELKSANSLNNNFLNCLLKDSKANIWIGTERGGVNFFHPGQNTFEHFEYEIGNPNSLSHSTINSVYEDENYLWIGTAGGGLNKYDKNNSAFYHYRYDPADDSSVSSDFITSIYRDQQGRLWVATWGSGLNLLLKEGTKKEHFRHFVSNPDSPGLTSNFISSIAEDAYGHLLIGTIGGLVKYDPSNDHFQPLFDEGSTPKITGVGCLEFENANTLWVGTRTGLFQLLLAKGKDGGPVYELANEYRHDPAVHHSISGNYIISAFQDNQGAMWFGTYGQGINKRMVNNDSVFFVSYKTANGLSNNIIYGIEQDENQNLWLSTDYGLSRLNPETGQVRNFYISDGLLNNQYYWSAAYKNTTGKLYFGGMNGLDAFYPEWINSVRIDPEVVITDIKLLNESVQPGKEYNGIKVLTKSVSKTDQLSLSYKEKIFSIEFSSLSYQGSDLVKYAYFLDGFDQSWNYVSSGRRFASYTNLQPGDYTFQVKASGLNGNFTSTPTLIKIHIDPPFWETIWFRISAFLALVGMVVGYIRFRIYNLKHQKLILERQVKERTERINLQKEALSFQAVQLQKNNTELAQKQELIEGQNHKLEHQRDELIDLNKKLKLVSKLKLSFFTNISHEFRTPLTLILGPLEKLISEKGLSADNRNTLNIISRNAQRLLHLINQIMDFRKIEKGRMELRVAKGNIEEFCQKIFQAFQPLAEIKEIKFSREVKDIPKEVWFDHQKIENILYNLLSNAFKYTPNGGKVRMEIDGLPYQQSRLNLNDSMAEVSQDVVSIRIIDSGIGISEENLPLVFKRFYRIESEEAFKISGSGIGLALTEELIKTHHGVICVESSPGMGSVFEIRFPCLKGAYGNNEVMDITHDATNLHQQVQILANEMLLSNGQIEEQEPYLFEKDRCTVLVVEDNADLRKFITHRLNKTYNIIEAEHGEMGIRLAEKHNPDLIISDIMMPVMDGLELCASIKNNLGTSHIPVILLTAKSTVENQIEGLEIGADDYLPKPFNFELLEARIQNLIESRNKLRLLFLSATEIDISHMASGTKDQKFLEHAIKTVEAHMEDSLFGVKEFVKLMGISRSLLHKKLTALTDQSAAEFINQLRMKKAMQLLKANELNISGIAYSVGYNDPKYFSRLFSRYYGKSPRDFLITMGIIH